MMSGPYPILPSQDESQACVCEDARPAVGVGAPGSEGPDTLAAAPHAPRIQLPSPGRSR